MANNSGLSETPGGAKTKSNKLENKKQEQQNNASKPTERISIYEKNRRAVYATGNKWAIENFHATHD
jgi:hypothetical protein